MDKNYYVQKKDRLKHEFNKFVYKYFSPVLIKYFDKCCVDNLLNDVCMQFDMIIPHIPFIGGAKIRLPEI